MAISTTHDIVPDSPTNTFATLNPLDVALRNGVISDNNLKTTDSTSNWSTNYANIVPKSGIYYVEFYIQEVATTSAVGIFVGNDRTWPDVYSGSGYPFDTNTFWVGNNGSIYHNNSTTAYSNTFTDGNIVSLIIDYTTRNFWVRVNNNIVSGDDHTGSQSGGVAGALSLPNGLPEGDMFVFTVQRGQNNNTAQSQMCLNFGQDHTFGGYPNSLASSSGYSDANGIGSFYYQPPTGALALCTANLPSAPDLPIDPAVDDVPEDYMKAVTYTGTGSAQSINVGFQPDLVWVKTRNYTANTYNLLFDSARGATKWLSSNATSQEGSITSSLTSFDSNGFSLGSDPSGSNLGWNINGYNHIAWCFRAGGNENTFNWGDGTGSTTYSGIQLALSLPASSTSGMITPSGMSVNQKAGFSIVKYTGTGSAATVPHGLSVAPEMVIIKNLDVNSTYWVVYHREHWEGSGANNLLLLPYSAVTSPNSTIFNSTQPSSSVVTLGTNGGVNTTSINYIMYCWHSVAGYSSIGSYEGNSSTDGPYVHLGFRPAWLLLKNIDTATDWWLMDTTRDPYNVAEKVLYPNLPDSEFVSAAVFGRDFLSNGFKVRNNQTYVNGNYTYIYAAFAETPFKYANAR